MVTKLGTAGNDMVLGTNGDDFLNGLAGKDQLTGGKGADRLIGGAGVDTVHYDNSSGAVSINLQFNQASGGDATGDTYREIENVVGSKFADQVLGNGGANVLKGLAGNDLLLGLAGDDTLVGGAGADRLEGDNGSDTVDYSNSAQGVFVQLNFGVGHLGDAEGDTYDTIESVTGSGQSDEINGSSGNNVLKGLGGVDVLKGDDGNDTLEGGVGADLLDGGNGFDAANYANSAQGVFLRQLFGTETTVGKGGEAEGDTLLSIETIQGSAFKDVVDLRDSVVEHQLLGGAGNDSLISGDAKDTIRGDAGDDLVNGGAGGDVLDGGTGSDTVDYFGSAGGVFINLATNTALNGAATGDVIRNFENVTGSDLADTLLGDGGANKLIGLGGRDTLNGQSGNDVVEGNGQGDMLTGGSGADRFAYQSGGDSTASGQFDRDVITDFSHADGDKIDFSFMSATSDTTFRFLGIKAGSQQGDISFAFSGNDTIVTVESGGGNSIDMSIQLSGHVNLVAGDFIL